MRKYRTPQMVALAIMTILILVACSSANGGKELNAQDMAATQISQELTQVAIFATPTEAPTTETPATEESAGSIDYTSLQSGDLAYSTDFDSPGDWEDGWIKFPIPSSDNYSVIKENGHIKFVVNGTNLSAYAFPDFIYFPQGHADVSVKILEENVGSTNLNNIGVFCRGNENGWYEFALLSGGEWYIWKVVGDQGYQLLASGGIPNFDYYSPHYVAGECIGDTLTIYIDDNMPVNGSVTDDSFQEGGVGMFVYARERAGVQVDINEFTVAIP